MDGSAPLPAILGTGQTLIRPVQPLDGPALAAHVKALSPASRRNRYLGGVNELSAREIERIVTGHGGRLRAIVAEAEGPAGPVVVGEALVAAGTAPRTAEFALSVADDWRRRGLGTRLLARIAWLALSFGASRLAGETLRDNEAMAALAAANGFDIRTHPEDARLLMIERPVVLPALVAGLAAGGPGARACFADAA
ncbi:GNAT family N-acetyltransferase [Phreatobacter sp.]|uniref:GNAT family N-acetyltransferase n=1 Tax=Phreatobacter sp. TaxID=1966341 RepID=UPI003F731041